jgi:hypothetical protein
MIILLEVISSTFLHEIFKSHLFKRLFIAAETEDLIYLISINV